MNFLRKTVDFAVGLLVRGGLCTFKLIAAVILAAGRLIGFILGEAAGIFRTFAQGLKWLLKSFTESYRSRVQVSNELAKNARHAKKEGKKAYINAILRFIGSFLFGEGGALYTAFNYLLPIVSAVFMISVIAYGSSLEYGLAVEYNGKELGVISDETELEAAARDVQQRISYGADDKAIDLSSKFSLRIMSDSDKLMSAAQLADEMLEASDEELTEAYGIYIDGEFIGAVKDHRPVQDALDKNLLDYKTDGIVKELSYADKIEYTKGIYLLDSLRDEQETIELLTSTTEKSKVYVVKAGDTVLDIIQKFGMKVDDFNKLNPKAEEGLKEGQMLSVTQTERYLPVQYTRELETLTFLDYETIEVETSALNVGIRALLVKGERGEKVSNLEVTYIDGIEQSRKVLSSVITKAPVVETIGIGTYSAMPDDPATVYCGQPLAGSGQMGWPVNGGWISDPFISDRNHKGLDIAAPEGTEIYAAEEGEVVSAGWNSGGYGNVVMIEHPDGYATVYAHMVMVYALEGQYVTKGQLIGFVGSTGNSTGPHCHFEVRYQGICLDPTAFMNTLDAIYKEDEE